MVFVSLQYEFRQPFRVSAERAYRWCTDFRASDAALYGDGRNRSVRWLSDDTLVMTDTTRHRGRALRIARLVRLNPRRLSWTNTHLNGPYRHSQFWYRIVPDGPRRSHLEFVGLKVERHPRRLAAPAVRRRARAEARSDAATWRNRLAPALDRELGTA